MNIIFIRHSKSLVNPDVPIATWALSDEGVDLAKKLKKVLGVKSIEVIYSSLQPKALETAILATKDLGIPIRTHKDLTESTSFTNKFVNLQQLEENTREYYKNPDLSINNGETSKEAVLRFNTAINEIVRIEKGRKVIGIVSHGSILADFSAQYFDKSAYEIVHKMGQPDIAEFNFEKKEFAKFFGEISF